MGDSYRYVWPYVRDVLDRIRRREPTPVSLRANDRELLGGQVSFTLELYLASHPELARQARAARTPDAATRAARKRAK